VWAGRWVGYPQSGMEERESERESEPVPGVVPCPVRVGQARAFAGEGGLVVVGGARGAAWMGSSGEDKIGP
jgi:hypothetical protein